MCQTTTFCTKLLHFVKIIYLYICCHGCHFQFFRGQSPSTVWFPIFHRKWLVCLPHPTILHAVKYFVSDSPYILELAEKGRFHGDPLGSVVFLVVQGHDNSSTVRCILLLYLVAGQRIATMWNPGTMIGESPWLYGRMYTILIPHRRIDVPEKNKWTETYKTSILTTKRPVLPTQENNIWTNCQIWWQNVDIIHKTSILSTKEKNIWTNCQIWRQKVDWPGSPNTTFQKHVQPFECEGVVRPEVSMQIYLFDYTTMQEVSGESIPKQR